VNVRQRSEDYPHPDHILPTRLGNVLRRGEEEAGIEGGRGAFIQAVFDDLPLSLKIEHDEQRARLDMYSSMVYIVVLVSVVGAVRFCIQDVRYSVASVVIGALCGVLMYRAALTTARAFAGLLGLFKKYAKIP
jgi:hypothetical protein